jgi:hypothetical protein
MNELGCIRTLRRALWMTCGAGVLIFSSACAGSASIDGYDGMYVEAAPPGIEAYPRYPFRDGYIYDVHGRWYHQRGGRWVAYAHRPREIARDHHRR